MKNSPWPAPPADAPLPRQPDVPGQRKATLKRYTWARSHHDLPGKDEWQLVADMAGCSRDRVEAFIWRLETYASTNKPRGSVEGFPLRAVASTWRCDVEQLAKIYAALEEPDVGWLEDDAVITFWERNPDQEDPTGADRARRSRRRRKIIKAMQARKAKTADILAELEAQGVGYPQVRPVTRDTVTVTTRADQSKGQDGENPAISTGAGGTESPQAIHKEDGDYGTPDRALVWLGFHGKRIIIQRLNEPSTRAQQRIERWLAQLGGNAVAMARIIDTVDLSSDVNAAQFFVLMSNSIGEFRRNEDGQAALPLRPTLATTTRRSRRG